MKNKSNSKKAGLRKGIFFGSDTAPLRLTSFVTNHEHRWLTTFCFP